jgi:hypothetical protein
MQILTSKLWINNQSSVFKTITILVNVVFPDFEIKKPEDVYDIAYKILQYPYDISNHVFMP